MKKEKRINRERKPATPLAPVHLKDGRRRRRNYKKSTSKESKKEENKKRKKSARERKRKGHEEDDNTVATVRSLPNKSVSIRVRQGGRGV